MTLRVTPVDVTGLASGVASLSTGDIDTCVLSSEGGVKCWGDNTYGQLGDGTTTQRSTAGDVTGLTTGVTAVAVNGLYTCAIVAGGSVKCWGFNQNGQLGNSTTTASSTPVDVTGLTGGVTAITLGYDHACALLSGGGVKCWGNNATGQLGDGTTTNRSTPVTAAGLMSGVTAITAGNDHTCALVSGGGVKCWGNNTSGQLGDGNVTPSPRPVDVTGLTSGVTAIAAGNGHTCAILSGGGVKCWGNNATGQLGDGTMTQRTTPVSVAGPASGVTAITTGNGFTCAIISGGGAECWGNNASGQLGDGTTTPRSTPAAVTGLTSGVTIIAAGGNHTCALVSSGQPKCWGSDSSGQLGLGTIIERLMPVDVIG